MSFEKNLPDGHTAYQTAMPFPHAVIDDYLPAGLAERALATYPKPDDPIWRSFGREYVNPGNGRKFEMPVYSAMPPALRETVDLVHSEQHLQFVRDITGYHDLFTDPTLMGGGLNMSMSGGFLRVHADFNFNNELKSYRTINLLLYFNKDWREEYGGGLELWARDMSRRERVILPMFNRAVIFTTFCDAYHGFPVVATPDGRGRLSMNFYFYRREAAPGISAEPHKTLWQTE